MQKKLIGIVSVAMLLSASVASAAGLGAGNANAETGINVNANVTVGAGASASSSNQGGYGSSAQGNASTSASAGGSVTAEAHRSTVATFVQSLLDVANREGGIGAQVRVIAKSQNDSASTTESAMAHVESRGALTTLLIGADYKNIGVLRSELATTSANIRHLKELMAQAVSDADKAELAAQIQVLEDSQAAVESFVTAHENSFSFFGWFVKLFVD